jgi:hypothetical protein
MSPAYDWRQLVDIVPAFEREILIALQGSVPNVLYDPVLWERVEEQIRDAPVTWRWWIRMHPDMSRQLQAAADYRAKAMDRYVERVAREARTAGSMHTPLLKWKAPNRIIDQDASCPLPAILARVSVVITQFSTVAVEAAKVGVPTLFLLEKESREMFPSLYASGMGRAVAAEDINAAIAAVSVKVAA